MPRAQTATLVMDSRHNLISVRSQSLMGSWSQLFKAGNRYLDLNFQNKGAESVLFGYLVSDPGTPISTHAMVRLSSSTVEYQTTLSSSGSFRITLNGNLKEMYCFELDLSDQVISIDRLEI